MHRPYLFSLIEQDRNKTVALTANTVKRNSFT